MVPGPEAPCLAKVAFSPAATLVASAAGHVIHLRDRTTETLRRVLRGHPATFSALTFSPDGTTLFSGDTKGLVKRWEVTPAAESSPFGEATVSRSGDGAALCWNVNAQQVRFQHWAGEPLALDVDPRGKERHVFHGASFSRPPEPRGKRML